MCQRSTPGVRWMVRSYPLRQSWFATLPVLTTAQSLDAERHLRVSAATQSSSSHLGKMDFPSIHLIRTALASLPPNFWTRP
jgi:hypothetical protein